MTNISPRVLRSATALVTLVGIILAFSTIADAYRDGQSATWDVVGLVLAVLGAITLFDRVLDVFGKPEDADSRMPRLVGGGMSLTLFLIFSATIGLFQFAV